MELVKAIQRLIAEKESIMRAIVALEALEQGGLASGVETKTGRSRRGRKSMGSAERQEVSLRMKKYWAAQRVKREDNLGAK